MNNQIVSGNEPSDEPKELALAEANSSSYTLTEEDKRELQGIRKRLVQLEQRIHKLDPPNAHQKELKETFPLDPGSNRRAGGTQFKKRFDASIERAARASPLYQEHLRLLAQEKALLSGVRARERELESARQKKLEEDAERVLHARPGDYIIDSAYGLVRVVRVNSQSLTIEMESGRHERRKFSLIKRIAFTEEELIDWFVKRDTSGAFPIRAFLREMSSLGKSIEEIAICFKDETRKRYPDFISNLPWQNIVQHFLDI